MLSVFVINRQLGSNYTKWRKFLKVLLKIMEIPYFVKELLELSLMMRAKEQWEETNAKKGTIFWQPWLDRGIFHSIILFFFLL